MTHDAYRAGASAADATFGVRTAEDVGRMPDGPKHLGASRFAAMVGEDATEPAKRKDPWSHRLERETMWGQPSSPESGGISNNDSALRYGGT